MSTLLFKVFVSDFPTTKYTEVALNAEDNNIYSISKYIETITQNIQTWTKYKNGK